MEMHWNYIESFSIYHSSFLLSLFFLLLFKVRFILRITVYINLYKEISGLIIDAFGDLREQLDSVKETLEVRNQNSIVYDYYLRRYVV
jgi:hypothetical protein